MSYARFDPNADAQQLHEWLANANSHDDKVLETSLELLSSRTIAQRQLIKRAYRTQFKQELQDAISHVFKGTDGLLNGIMHLPEDFDAKELYGAMKGLGTTETTLTEILCTRTSDEIKDAAFAYRHWYGVDLKKDIAGDTSGDYRTLLLLLAQGQKDEHAQVDMSQAAQTAQLLSNKKTSNEEWINVLGTQNSNQLRAVFEEYQRATKHPIEDGVKKEFGGDAEMAVLAIVKATRDRPDFFAEIIHENIKKGKEEALLRIVCGRSEKDLHEICHSFMQKYRMPLDNFVEDNVKDKKAQRIKEVCLRLIRGAHRAG